MVYHERPDDENRPLITYICSPNQKEMVNKCIKLLDSFSGLKVWETQCPTEKDYTCFYVSFRHTETPWILNFTIYPKYTNVEFRYPQYLPDEFLDGLKWITGNWAYERYSSDNEDRIKEMLSAYISNIREPFDDGKLKQGGKSFAESLIADLIRDAFPALFIKRNMRPDWLRSEKGKPIELDIVIPDLQIALEIQGPQHFEQIYGDKSQHQRLKKNDLLKKQKCREKGMRLVWMSVDGINQDIIRVPKKEKLRIIKDMISTIEKRNGHFMFWKNSKEQILE